MELFDYGILENKILILLNCMVITITVLLLVWNGIIMIYLLVVKMVI